MTLIQLDIDIDIDMDDEEDLESFRTALSIFLSTHCGGFKSLTTRTINVIESNDVEQIYDIWEALKLPKLDNS